MKEVWVVEFGLWPDNFKVDSVWVTKGAAEIRVQEIKRNSDDWAEATRFLVQG